MTPRVVVLNLGMPRSGTTLVQKMLERGTGYAHQKVCEFHDWHPMNGPHLGKLVNTFRHKRVVVVRTSRALEDVVESMRIGVEMGNPHPWSRGQVRQLHRTERQNWHVFLGALEGDASPLDPSVQCHAVAFDYEEMGDPARRDVHLRRIARHTPDPEVNRAIWDVYLSEVWGTKPVNVGRLMQKVGPPPDEEGDVEE